MKLLLYAYGLWTVPDSAVSDAGVTVSGQMFWLPAGMVKRILVNSPTTLSIFRADSSP